MTDFLEKLASTPSRVGSSDRLAMLGKRAAAFYVGREAESLTDAVGRVVAEEGDLSSEQVRRVAEAANQATWDELFVKNGDKQVSFEPADSSQVLESLSIREERVSPPMLDYLDEPRGEQIPADLDLKQVFGVKDPEDYPLLNPLREAQEQSEKTAAALDVTRSAADALLSDLEASGERFYHLVKQAHLRDGHGFLQVAKAVGAACEDDGFVQRVMEKIAERLKSEGVRFKTSQEIEKLAQAVVVNAEHPLLVEAVRFEKLAAAYKRAAGATEKLSKHHGSSMRALRDKLREQ